MHPHVLHKHISLCLYFLLFLLKFLFSFFGFRFTQEPNRSIRYINRKNNLWKIYCEDLKYLTYLQTKWISYLHFGWLPDNHSAFTLWNKVSHKKNRDSLATSWKNGLKMSFLSEIWRIMKNDQLSSNLELLLLCTIWNICIYNILKYYIFSSRNEQYHGVRWLVYPFQFWMFGRFCFVCHFFFSRWGRYMPVWESNMALSLESQLQADSWNLRHSNNTESRASLCFYLVTQGSSSSCFIAFYPVQY